MHQIELIVKKTLHCAPSGHAAAENIDNGYINNRDWCKYVRNYNQFAQLTATITKMTTN